jgi:hypothetical protein
MFTVAARVTTNDDTIAIIVAGIPHAFKENLLSLSLVNLFVLEGVFCFLSILIFGLAYKERE